MIPAQFDYHSPGSLEEALSLLEQFGDDAKILAGGHSLIPAMRFRLAMPENLVDINGLGAVTVEPEMGRDGVHARGNGAGSGFGHDVLRISDRDGPGGSVRNSVRLYADPVFGPSRRDEPTGRRRASVSAAARRLRS